MAVRQSVCDWNGHRRAAGIDREGEPSVRPAQGGLQSAWIVTG